jgi:hypothetical protein
VGARVQDVHAEAVGRAGDVVGHQVDGEVVLEERDLAGLPRGREQRALDLGAS